MLSNILSGGFSFADGIVYIISALAVIFLTLPIHEFAHGLTAVKLGDNTPRWQGRLTLNPFAHIDYMGALFILLFGFGWAKPVQVNHLNFRNPKRDMAITALAGPVSNIIMAFIFYVIYFCLAAFGTADTIISSAINFCVFVSVINVKLAVFNLIPVPPLDGSRILTAFLPNRTYYKIMQYERYIYLCFMLLLFTNVLDLPINTATNAIINLFRVICVSVLRIFI